jgi:hypothetical protein
MRSIVTITLLAATACAQGVTQYIAPTGRPPAGCVDSKAGEYELSVQPIGNSKRWVNAFPQREIVRHFSRHIERS